MTRLSCHRIRLNEVRLWLSVIAYNPVASSGAAEANRGLVVDEFAATAGEDRRAAGKTCQLLLAAAGRERFEAAALRKHRAQDGGATRTMGIGQQQGGADFGDAGCNESSSIRGIPRQSWDFGVVP
jgi:hypothetical protein